jgi:anti-anti-sigma regulatory factor
MPTQITQVDDHENRSTTLLVSGEMFEEDAQVLAKVARNIRSESGNTMALDFADLDFLDSDAAAVLRELSATDGFTLRGLEIFLQSAVDQAERRPR